MEGKPRALFLSPEAPYPLAGGGALRSASLLHCLARRYEVDLVVFRQPGGSDPAAVLPAGLARRVSVIDLPINGRGPAARYLRNAFRLARQTLPLMDRFSGFGHQVADAISGRRYALAVVEHLWCAPYWEQISAVCERTLLDLHNIESVWHARCAEAESGLAALAHRIFSRAAAKLEREWVPRFTQVLTTSPEDQEKVLIGVPTAHVAVFPNAIPLVPIPRCEPEEAIVFSGNLEYHPNVCAVRFFRREVWPILRERWPALVWRLVGKNPKAIKRWTAGDSRIEVIGPVANAIAELARAKVAVVPLLTGSGTRFKILEAWAAARPVVSTRIGAEGLPVQDGEHLLLANGAREFADAVSRVLASTVLAEELGLSGRCILEQRFTWEKLSDYFDL